MVCERTAVVQYLAERHTAARVSRPIVWEHHLSTGRGTRNMYVAPLSIQFSYTDNFADDDIPGASKHSTNAFAHAWKLPCNSKFRLTVTFGSFSTSLDQSSLVVKQKDGLCVGVLQEWIDANATEYLLGSPFIAVLYLWVPALHVSM